MFSGQWLVGKLILLFWWSNIFVVDAIAPQIQTNVFKGVPDNWASNISIDPFVKIGQKYYYIVTVERITWHAAAHECSRRNARLLSIESAAEFDALNEYFKEKKTLHWYWTSGNDLAKEGAYYWLGTGNPIGFARWESGEPNNENGNQNCLGIGTQGEQYAMTDWDCLGVGNYICEAKTPTTVALTLW